MARAHALLPFVMSGALAGVALSAGCKTESKPPVSNGPGNGAQGSGGGSSEAGVDGGSAANFATFTGFTPTGIAADGDTIYVTLTPVDSTAAGEVVRVDGSGVVTSLVTDAVAPTTPAVAGGALYYVDKPTGSTPSSIMRLDLSNVAAGERALVSGVTQPSAIVVVGNSVLIASSAGGTGVEVDSVPITGGSTTPVSSVPGEYSAAGLATDGTDVYFAARGVTGGQIVSAPLVGGPANPIWSGSDVGTLGTIVAANGNIYFALTNDPNGVVDAVPISGGTATPLATGLTAPSGLVASDSYVYFTSNVAEGSISRAPLLADAGVPPAVVTGVAFPSALALGSTVVYATTDDGVVRVLK